MNIKIFIWNLVYKYPQINWLKFIRYNFFCKKVVRAPGCYIFPYRHTKIQIKKGSKIIINGNFVINADGVVRSSVEGILSLGNNATLEINGKCVIQRGVTMIINSNAYVEVGDNFTANTNFTLNINEKCIIGNDVMIGSEVIIYDSNFHPTGSSEYDMSIKSAPVIIGNHVWICTRSMIMKGSNIGSGGIIGANSYVEGDAPCVRIDVV